MYIVRNKKLLLAEVVGAAFFIILIGLPAVFAQTGESNELIPEKPYNKDLGIKGEVIIPSMDLHDAELSSVLRGIAKYSGLNIIAGDEVTGKVSLYWQNVSVKDALDAILSTNNYGYIHEGNVLRILPAEKLGEEKVKTITKTFQINYLEVKDVEETLVQFISQDGKIKGDTGSNVLVVTDIPQRVEEISALVETLDKRVGQVRIEARLIEVRIKIENQLGVDWSYFQNPENQFNVNLSPYNLGSSDAAGEFRFGIVSDPHNFTGFIQAAFQSDDIKVLANPSILAQDNKTATIKILDQRPYVEANVSSGVITETVQFRETGVILEVVPHITNDGYVLMHVKPEQKIPGPLVVLQNSTGFNVDERMAETDLIVKDGTTVVIGGLRTSDLQYTTEKVPVLGDIPILGLAFQHKSELETQTEMMLFITPYIVHEIGDLSLIEQASYDRFDKMNPDIKDSIYRFEEDQDKRYEKLEDKYDEKPMKGAETVIDELELAPEDVYSVTASVETE